LIEVMIVVVIVGILAAIAYPSYQNYLKRAARSAAQTLMLDLANREQQYLLDNRSFLGGGASAVTTLLSPVPVPPEVSVNYDLSIAAAAGPPPTFTVTATPKAGTIVAGEAAFTLDQAGTKLPAGKWEGR
jgi:type IV pilus assembly protein PilE